MGLLRIGGQVDEDAMDRLAVDQAKAHGAEQGAVHWDVQQGGKFLRCPAGLGLVNEAGHGCGEAAVLGEAHGTEREQAEAVEALRVEARVVAPILVVAAQVGDLAEVAEGRPKLGQFDPLPGRE